MYLGASFSLETSGRKRLVIDIGGGSTELIVGQAVTSPETGHMGNVG